MSDSLGFLVSDVSRLMRRSFDERVRSIGVTRPQWRVLTALSRNEGIHQGGMAEYLEVEPITLCRMVDRLQEAGLVERRADPADRRAWRLFLTPAAAPLLDQIKQKAETMFDDALVGLTLDEQVKLNELLERVRRNLSRKNNDQNGAAAHG